MEKFNYNAAVRGLKNQESSKVEQEIKDTEIEDIVSETVPETVSVTEPSVQEEAVPTEPVVTGPDVVNEYIDPVLEKLADSVQNDIGGYSPSNNSDDIKMVPPTSRPETIGSDDDLGIADDESVEELFADLDNEQEETGMPENKQQEPVQDNPVQNRPVRKAGKSAGNEPVKMSNIRSFPRDLAIYVKNMFGGHATTMDEAIAAYIYLKEGCPQDIPVPDHIKDLVHHFTGDNVTNSDLQYTINKELRDLKKLNRILVQKLSDIMLGVVYGIHQQMGFSTRDPALTSGEVDFLESSVTDMRKRLENQSRQQQMREEHSKNRPIR